MKIEFNKLAYQDDAINSSTELFLGQEVSLGQFTIDNNKRDNNQTELWDSGLGTSNHIRWDDDLLNQAIQRIQLHNGITPTKLNSKYPQFNIEMETGTGKTFVYFKTILELNKQYGFTKFVIVVPSIAIKEGVMSTYRSTKKYFKNNYSGVVYNANTYDGSSLQYVRDFALNTDIEIMVINIQSFTKGIDEQDESKKNIIYRKDIEDFRGTSAIDLIANTNPIVMIDEPQSTVSTGKQRRALDNLNPLSVFRYSATHKDTSYPMIYRLGPVESYEQELVKQIQVSSVQVDMDGNQKYIKLIKIENNTRTVRAQVEVYTASDDKKKLWLTVNDSIAQMSGNHNYDAFGVITDISARKGAEFIEFSGEPAFISMSDATIEDEMVQRVQLREMIREHLNRELQLNVKGIKVLSLVFLDKVRNYREYDEDGVPSLGKYAKIFEEEYKDLIQTDKFKNLRDKDVPVGQVHNGYFSTDGKKTNAKLTNTTGSSAKDESTYDMIMKNKEGLLTFYDSIKGDSYLGSDAHKVRFIFSHSALKEGWDNPNIFQIATLVETKNELTKRQKIGRGLRIAVNQEGKRVMGRDVNTLTVFANESYKEFASGLQHEYEQDGVQFGVFESDTFGRIVIEKTDDFSQNKILGIDKSTKLVEHFKSMKYLDKKNHGTQSLLKAIKDDTLDIPEEFESSKDQIVEIIQHKMKLVKEIVKDSRERKNVEVNNSALNTEFNILWDKIKHKTTFNVEINDEMFVILAAAKMKDKISVKKTKYIRSSGKFINSEGGIDTKDVGYREYSLKETKYDLPDIVGELKDATNLPRKTIIAILKKYADVTKFKRNPKIFIAQAARAINLVKDEQMVAGIHYIPIDDEYSQTLITKADVSGYIGPDGNIEEAKSDKTPFDFFPVDSNVERKFIQDALRDDSVDYFIKLPSEFKIRTPLGTYNPDWAVARQDENQDGKQLYFVADTKANPDGLRDHEKLQTRAGKAHFEAINKLNEDENVHYKVISKLDELFED